MKQPKKSSKPKASPHPHPHSRLKPDKVNGFENAFEELHAAALSWGALVQRMEHSSEFEASRKKLQVAAYAYYKTVMELVLTRKKDLSDKTLDTNKRRG